MPLAFEVVCELLDESYKSWAARKPNRPVVETWFARNATRIAAHDNDLAALLSTLLPEKRTDRVYYIQVPALENIIGRGLGLGISRRKELARHREPGSGVDLADCVHQILTITPNQLHPDKRVTVEEVDQLLHGLACRIKFSSPAIRATRNALTQRDRTDLDKIYSRLTATEAKWFTRLVLKSYAPLIFEENLILRLCDPSLPVLLKIRQDFASAVNVAQEARSKLLPALGTVPDVSRQKFLARVKPLVGIKVGRQHWAQARSIKHCQSLVNGRVSVQSKVDGEYCQIHVDRSKGSQCIQIFSKSGKDSTEDREALHRNIVESLRIGRPDCAFSKSCIIEGELAVYSDLERRILPFHKIRNHVTRRGLYMNTDEDSLPKAHEHLIIVYFDIVLLDDQSFLGVRHSERFKKLADVVQTRTGWAELVKSETVDFDHPLAASNLRKAFAQTIVNRQEGLVLKPDEPYFDLSRLANPICGRCIKLKKEYIGKFGDVGDFAAVGAGYDPIKAKQHDIPNLRWTHFYIGCLANKEEAKRLGATPKFIVVAVVELNPTQLRMVTRFARPIPVPRDVSTMENVDLPPAIETRTKMTVVFSNPIIFDMRCFSFEKPGNVGFWTLRFPGVSKVHFDRGCTDVISFEELQDMAKTATTSSEHPDSQENLMWIAKLEQADPRGIAVDAVSQLTASTVLTPSPHRSISTVASGRSQSPLKQKRPGNQARERLSQPCSQTCPMRKKQKLAETACTRVHAPTLSPTHAPLAEMDLNAIQCPVPSSTNSCEEPSTEASSESIDRLPPSSRSQSPTVTDGTLSSPRLPPDSPRSSECVMVFPSDPISKENQQSASEPQRDGSLPLLGRHKSGCIHAGHLCHFSKKLVFLASHLKEPPSDVANILKSHDIEAQPINHASWAQYLRRGSPKNLGRGASDTILLVDSIRHGSEAESLIDELGKIRVNVARSRLDWVIVYDWRVLEHITILEDDSITRKYYDGFKDPWRRWYCGLI